MSAQPGNYFDTRCPSGRHYEHAGSTCEEIGNRRWDPVFGYRTEEQVAADPIQFTGLLGLAARES
ncbi:hypothetical protein [Streptomyces violaceoruber]|uniref:hypothetical protein n=1 Tax=Streptomyces violaceoruber TaxID=1935 RepID=UPI003B43B760